MNLVSDEPETGAVTLTGGAANLLPLFRLPIRADGVGDVSLSA